MLSGKVLFDRQDRGGSMVQKPGLPAGSLLNLKSCSSLFQIMYCMSLLHETCFERYKGLAFYFLFPLMHNTPTCNNIAFSQYKEGRSQEWDLMDEGFWGLAFCSLCLVKGYVLPGCPLFKKKKKKIKLFCKAIILFTSRCMYKEWRGEDGNVREMSNACWLCPLYFCSWNVLSREEGPGQGDCGGPRSHLLVTLNRTGTNLLWID